MSLEIGWIVGSTSTQSVNRRLAAGLIATAVQLEAEGLDPALRFTELPISPLPVYNRDLDDRYPPEADALKRDIRRCDGLIVITPEYNRSIPGVLKNALDWASRPYGDNALTGKPTAIIGASPGALGTAVAQQHLRSILAYLDAPVMGQPEAYIQYTPDRFAEDGAVIDEATQSFLADWLRSFHAWTCRFRESIRTGDS